MTAVLEIFRHAKIIAAGNPPINGTGIERSCKSLGTSAQKVGDML